MISSLPKTDRVDAKIVMQDQYEYRFGIFNHGAVKDRPMSSVAMFESENYTERSLYYDALTEYAEGGYRDIWGLDVHEFLNQPTYIVKMMKEITHNVIAKKNNVVDEVKAKAEREMSKKSK